MQNNRANYFGFRALLSRFICDADYLEESKFLLAELF